MKLNYPFQPARQLPERTQECWLILSSGAIVKSQPAQPYVLVIDDDDNMRFFMINVLKTAGFEVTGVGKGSKGLLTAQKKPPAIIILNVIMPDEEALFIYGCFRHDAHLKHIPIIMLSGIDPKTFFHYQKFEGAQVHGIPYPDAYLENPPEAEYLVNTVRRLIDKKETPCPFE
jgi:DNA-binding response OmpR family regulator